MSVPSQETLFRRYSPDECSLDGYPRAWHDLGAGHPLAVWENGKRIKHGVKHIVRELAGHRCARCQHFYKGGGQWTPCDERCSHRGPVRLSYRADDGSHVENLEHDLATEAGVVVGYGKRVHAAWRILTVHHLTGEKADLRWWNLAPLCQRCHLTIQGRVLMARVWPHEHSEWFKPYAAGWYAASYLGEDLTREQTEARMDELLALEMTA